MLPPILVWQRAGLISFMACVATLHEYWQARELRHHESSLACRNCDRHVQPYDPSLALTWKCPYCGKDRRQKSPKNKLDASKRPRVPGFHGVVTCKGDQYVPSQETPNAKNRFSHAPGHLAFSRQPTGTERAVNRAVLRQRIVLHLGVLSMEKPLRARAASRPVPNATDSIDFLARHCASRRGE
jgi:hypothetical protein